MTTLIANAPASTNASDAELISASRQGDREAFGRIVRRYQGMVTGLIYAACGDLHRSEDLAQDTFISAWKSLSGLRDASKLPAWLCQVARHRLLDDARSSQRHDARLAKAFHDRADAQPAAPSAEEQLLSNEERELLWHTLREIPQPYRETLVLYYRQGKSAGDVALATDTTEANVRQRLTRGREMLREQVAAMLERNLARSAPNAAFAVAVVAALPAMVPQAATAATIGSAAVKGTAVAAKGTGLLAAVAMWIGPAMGVLGGALGAWNSIRSAQHPAERKFIVRTVVEVWIFVIVAVAFNFGIVAARHHYRFSGATFGLTMSAFWLAYIALLSGLILAKKTRQRQLRERLGLSGLEVQPSPIGGERGRWIAFAGASVGALAWMFGLALQAKDSTAAAVVMVAVVLAVVACRSFVPNRTLAQLKRFTLAWVLAISAFLLVMVNWRIYAWIAATSGISLEAARRQLPFWTLNLFTLVICIVMTGIVLISLPRRLHQGTSDDAARPN
jgi:RNA polymerase sigma factor (sigma-70 family)